MHTLSARFTLLFIIFIDGMGIGIVYPVFTYYFLEHNTLFVALSHEARLFYLGLTFAIYPFFMAIGSLQIGKLSDAWGRKKALGLCLIGFCCGFFLTILGILFHIFWLILISRALAGLTAGAHVIAQASMADMSEGAEKIKNMGAVIIASTLGFVMGPALGGLLSSPEIMPFFTTATPFIVVMGMGLVALGLMQLFFKETFTRQSLELPESFNIHDIQFFKNRFIMHLALVYFLFTMGWNLFFQFTPVYLEEYYHLAAATSGSFMSFIAFIFMLVIAWLVKPTLRYISLNQCVTLGLFLAGISIVMMLNTSTFFWLWFTVIPLCVGGGLAYTASLNLFSNTAGALNQGHIMGIASMIKSIAWTLAPILSGIVAYFNIEWPMICAAFCFAGALLISLGLKRSIRAR